MKLGGEIIYISKITYITSTKHTKHTYIHI